MPKGDCYIKTGKLASDIFSRAEKKMKGCETTKHFFSETPIKEKNGYIEFYGKPKVVHAQINKTSLGYPYGHAFIADDKLVYDLSNDRCIIADKNIYYALAGIKKHKPYYYEYTPVEVMTLMLKEGHYGSWDLETDSGV